MDLTMYSLSDKEPATIVQNATTYYRRYTNLLQNDEFNDLITRGLDHKSRTVRRFEMWSESITEGLF